MKKKKILNENAQTSENSFPFKKIVKFRVLISFLYVFILYHLHRK